MEKILASFDQKVTLKLKNLLVIVGMSVLFAVSAWISVPLPFSPVPMSITCQLILFSAAFLGIRAAYAVLFYVLQGISGLPVFANGGFGIPYLMGPTGGYLIGFIVAAFFVAAISYRTEKKSQIKLFGIMLLGNMLVYFFGLPNLALFIGWHKAFIYGLCPFVITDLVKLVIFSKCSRLNVKI